MEEITKRQAKALLLDHLPPDERTDAALARVMGVKQPSVSVWGGQDDPIPQSRAFQVRALLAERRDSGEPPPDLGTWVSREDEG